MIWRHTLRSERGFALPTILISSIVMIIVMLVAIQSGISIQTAIDNQYYEKLAQEASDSGIAMAVACIEKSDQTDWGGANGPLEPGTDCTGDGTAGYVLNDNNTRTRFEVSAPTTTSNGLRINATGFVERLRSSDQQVYKTFSSVSRTGVSFSNFDISSGNDSTCATVNGKLWCWGLNSGGQIGDGTTTDRATPYHITSGALSDRYVYKAVAGFEHTCAVAGTSPTPEPKSSSNPGVFCWGDNSNAQLGLGTTTNSSNYLTPTAAAASLPNGRTYTDISGSYNVCAIGDDGTTQRVWCWGENGTGQAGDNPANDPKKTPTEGAITADDGVIRDARNNSSSDTTSNSYPVNDVAKINVVNSSTGCLLTITHKALCWGGNGQGIHGVGTTSNSSVNKRWRASSVGGTVDQPVPSDYRFSKVVTNFGHACAIGFSYTATSDGKIYCWGGNGDNNGALDYRMSSNINDYQFGDVRNMVPSGTFASATFKDIALSDWSTCVLRSDGANDGKVYCWGYNQYGQLGNGVVSGYVPTGGQTTPSSQKPLAPTSMGEVAGLLAGKKVVKLAAGNRHFCAMTESGASYCWGSNDHGQLGDGTFTDRPSPVRTKVPINITRY